MPKAVELKKLGLDKELWEMCCGYINLDIEEFMAIQNRLMLGQIEKLNRSKLGRKLFKNALPDNVKEFRQVAPLTTYHAYCPELAEKQEDALPDKPMMWVHSSGRTGEYSCKWIPMTDSFINNLSPLLYGIGILSSCDHMGDSSRMPPFPRILYTVAPRPYMSGAMASLIELQTPLKCYPSLEKAEALPFEERIQSGFKEALSNGLDYFFGLSLVLATVGDRFSQGTPKSNILPLLRQPKAFMRLSKGIIRARLAKRSLLPKDIWSIKGIITSGLDSSVYKEKIKNQWGRYPLDLYACTEGGVIATQTWDFDSMTFIPNLNFLEFIPEKEHMKWQLDHNYKPQTILLNEVKAGESYEIVISNFYGGAMVRYRIGDMIRITSLRNDNLGINLPQMVFERRADDLLDFNVIRLTEKSIWQAIDRTGIPYEDWVAFKSPGEMVLNVLIEIKDKYKIDASVVEKAIYNQILKLDVDSFTTSNVHNDVLNMIKIKINVTLLPPGSFVRYKEQKKAEGADIAHLKPPHINPSIKILTTLLAETEIAPEWVARGGLPSLSKIEVR
jgi:hypothetical protein